MRRWSQKRWLFLGSFLIWITWVRASMMTSGEILVDFSNAETAGKNAEWSEHVDLTREGLGFDGDATQSRDGWVLTQPLGVGTAWRPATGLSVDVRVSPAPSPVKLADGSTYTPYGGRMFVRFGCDRKHWSSWQELLGEPSGTGQEFSGFRGVVGVPNRNRTRYEALHEQYRKQDVPWADDEEALAHWIVSREPDFFVKELPYAGYVQFLYETDFNGGQRLHSLRGTVGAGIGGLHQPPKDPAEYGKHEGPWRYVAP